MRQPIHLVIAMAVPFAEYRNQFEGSFWLGVDGFHIYVTAHMPINLRSNGVVILCHAFAEEHKASYRVLVSLARRLAEAGFTVIRFDHRGYGDSTGEFERFTIYHWMDDLHAVIRLARERFTNMPLIIGGLRLGGTLAVMSAQELQPDGLLLWQPIVNGKRFAQLNMARMKIQRQIMAYEAGEHEQAESHQGSIMPYSSIQLSEGDIFTDFNGYIITRQLYDDLASIDLLGLDLPEGTKCLLVQISGSIKLSGELARLHERLRSLHHYSAIAIREQPIWSLLGLVEAEELINTTVKWALEVFPKRCEIKGEPQELFSDMPTKLDGESIVIIGTKRGWLKGILSVPDSHNDIGIVFLHGWSGNRAGPHHMFTKLARSLKSDGYPSVRFDFYGRGESSGELFDGTLLTMIEDANCVIDWFAEHAPINKCITIGICSGGEVAVGCATHNGVHGCILWSAPVFAGLKNRSREMRKRWSYFIEYLRKLFRLTTWRKLISGQIQFGIIMRILFGSAKGNASRKSDAAVQAKSERTGDVAPSEALQLERKRLEAILKEFEGHYRKPTLMVYGTADPEAKPAIEWYQRIFEGGRVPNSVHLVRGANHSFYSIAWEQEVFDVTREWLSSLA